MSFITLGNKGNNGEIDFSKLRSSITKEALGIEEGSYLATIFDSINTNHEEGQEAKLDRNELVVFIEKIKQLCGKDTNLKEGEAKNFEINGEKIGTQKVDGSKRHKELIRFLSKLSELTKGIESVEQQESRYSEVITYEDGHTEEVFEDGSKIITKKDASGNKTITELNPQGEVVKTIEESQSENGVTTFVTEFKNGKKTKTVKTDENGEESILYDTNETPLSKTEKRPLLQYEMEYKYVDGNFKPIRQTFPEDGIEYVFNGDTTTMTITEENKTTVEVSTNNVLVSRKETLTNANGEQEATETLYDGENTTTNFYINDKKQYQIFTQNGKQNRVNYDESGNAVGVIVQYGESIQTLANKFGVKVEDLIRVNSSKVKGKYPNAYIPVGEEVKVPRDVQANEAVLQGRNSREVELAKYNRKARVQSKINDMPTIELNEILNLQTDRVHISNAEDLVTQLYVFQKLPENEQKKFSTRNQQALFERYQSSIPTISRSEFNALVQKVIKLNPQAFNPDGSLKGGFKQRPVFSLNITAPVEQSTFDNNNKQVEEEQIKKDDVDDAYMVTHNQLMGSSVARDILNTRYSNEEKFIPNLNRINKNNVSSVVNWYTSSANKSYKQIANILYDVLKPEEAKSQLNRIVNLMSTRAKELGVADTKIKQYIDKINKTSDVNVVDDTLKDFAVYLDTIERTKKSQRQDLLATTTVSGQTINLVINAGNSLATEADNALEEQLKQDGVWGWLYDGIKTMLDSDLTDEKMAEKIRVFQNKMKEVEKAYHTNSEGQFDEKIQNVEAFLNEYKKQFGECDPVLMKRYSNLMTQYSNATIYNNLQKTLSDLSSMTDSDVKKVWQTVLSELDTEYDPQIHTKEALRVILQDNINSLPKEYASMSEEVLLSDLNELGNNLFGAENNIMPEILKYSTDQQRGAAGLEMATMLVLTVATAGAGSIAGTVTSGGLRLLGMGAKASRVIGAVTEVTTIGGLTAEMNYGRLERRADLGYDVNEEEWNQAFVNSCVDTALIWSGMKYSQYIESAKNLTKMQKLGSLVTLDTTTGVAGDYVRNGEVTVEGVLYNLVFSVGGNLVGMIPAKKGTPAGTKVTQDEMGQVLVDPSTTPTLSKAVQNPTSPSGQAGPSNVRVGARKEADISAEITNLVQAENLNVDDAVRARRELQSISNRDARRKAIRELDEKIQTLSPNAQAQYRQAITEDLQNMAYARLNAAGGLTATDVRVIKEFAELCDDVNILNDMKQKLDNKYMTGGGKTSDYNNAISILDKRIKAIESGVRPEFVAEESVVHVEEEVEVRAEEPVSFPVNQEVGPEKYSNMTPEELLEQYNIAKNSNQGFRQQLLIEDELKKQGYYVENKKLYKKALTDEQIENFARNENLDRTVLNSVYTEETSDLLIACYEKHPDLVLKFLKSKWFNPETYYLGTCIHVADEVNTVLDILIKCPEEATNISKLFEDGCKFRIIGRLCSGKYECVNNTHNILINNSNLSDADIKNLKQRVYDNPELSSDIIELSELGLNYEQITKKLDELLGKRKNIQNSLEQKFPDEMNELKTTLGDEYYSVVKWEKEFHEGLTDEVMLANLKELNDASKYFARLSLNEQRYGKNFSWAKNINKVAEQGYQAILDGKSASEVLEVIAKGYGGDGREGSGVLRTEETFFRTPYDKFECYTEYYDRLSEVLNTRVSPYDDISLTYMCATSGDGGLMVHGCSIDACFKHVDELHSELKPLIDKVQSGSKLTEAEIQKAHDKIAEIYFLLANTTPYERGSNGISDVYMRSLYKSLNIEMSAMKHGVSLDLEAFCVNLDDYKKNWLSFFENEPTVITIADNAIDPNVVVLDESNLVLGVDELEVAPITDDVVEAEVVVLEESNVKIENEDLRRQQEQDLLNANFVAGAVNMMFGL